MDPKLGTLGDFADMVRTAGDRGIRVIADLVVNHTSVRHPWFQEARSSRDSPYRGFMRDDKPEEKPGDVVFQDEEESNWAYDEQAGQWYPHRFYTEQPDLNVANPEVRDELAQIAGFWAQQGLVGFRVDAVPFLIEPVGLPEGAIGGPPRAAGGPRAYLGRRRGDAILLGEVNLPPAQQRDFFGRAAAASSTSSSTSTRCRRCTSRSRGRTPRRSRKPWTGSLRSPRTARRRSCAPRRAHPRPARRRSEEVFAAFGPSEDMQLYGRGLRRRLPTMLAGDQARIRLVYSLAFSLDARALLRGGDRDGENLDIPGRLSVRSPMQWSAEPNGGFSIRRPGRPVPPADG